MEAVLTFIFALLAGYTVSHYTLNTFWGNKVAIIAISAVFGVLLAVFVSVL